MQDQESTTSTKFEDAVLHPAAEKTKNPVHPVAPNYYTWAYCLLGVYNIYYIPQFKSAYSYKAK